MKGIWAIKDEIQMRGLTDYMEGVIKMAPWAFQKIESPAPFFEEMEGRTSLSSRQAEFIVTDRMDLVQGHIEKKLFGAFLKKQEDESPDPKVLWSHFTVVELPINYVNFFGMLGSCMTAYKAFLCGSGNSFKIGSYEFVPQERCFIHQVRGDKIMMTEKESELLALLCAYGGEVVTKKRLLKEVWAYDDKVTTRTLESHIYALRKKMENFSGEIGLFTEAGGYRLGKAYPRL